MKYIFDHDFHIHSRLSSCSGDPEQTPERILQYAKDNGLKTICLTDHYWDEEVPGGATGFYEPQNTAHIKQSLPLPQTEGIEFLFGCETDMDKNGVIGLSKEKMNNFDFIVIPTTHLHMQDLTIDQENCYPEYIAKAWVNRFDMLLNADLPFHKVGVAHLACKLIYRDDIETYVRILDMIPEEDMVRLFSKAAELGVGIEINKDDFNFEDKYEESILRMFKIAKRCGCKFYMGSDAHTSVGLGMAKELLEKGINLLELTEDDKFYIKK